MHGYITGQNLFLVDTDSEIGESHMLGHFRVEPILKIIAETAFKKYQGLIWN